MKYWRKAGGAAALLLALAAFSAAQSTGQITGEVRDADGKPFTDLTVVIRSDEFGATYEVKTDKKGLFFQAGLRSGIYVLTFKNKGQTAYEMRTRVMSGSSDPPVIVDFKELVAKQGAEFAVAKKKEEEATAKFETMKTHFEAGIAAMGEAKTLGPQISRTPAAERAPLQERYAQLSQTAVTEFEAAEKAAPPNDSNLHKVLANLAQAYEASGKFAEAVAAYERAIALKPEAGYFLGLGTSLARTGKVEEAGAACDRATAVDKSVSANCWRNIGIVLYNTNEMGKAVVPLRKATEMEPGNAQTWYLLGAALVNTMGFKQEGDKVIPILQPGTVEAYQKCIELDANGPYGHQAKQGLEQLEALGLGISTKVKTRKK